MNNFTTKFGQEVTNPGGLQQSPLAVSSDPNSLVVGGLNNLNQYFFESKPRSSPSPDFGILIEPCFQVGKVGIRQSLNLGREAQPKSRAQKRVGEP